MMTRVLRSMVRSYLTPVLVCGVAILWSAGAANASPLTISGGIGTGVWSAEPGQSIPTGTGGTIDGLLASTGGGLYTFTYGAGLLAGDTGHGNATAINEFWVGPNEAAAEAAGHVFCTQVGDASCGNVPTPIGTSFTVSLPPGSVLFGFTFGSTNTDVILNGGTSTVGSYYAQIGLGTTPNLGPGDIAYLGLSDGPFATDKDGQDLVVKIQAVPEPSTWLLMGTGLLRMLGYRRRQRRSNA